MIDNKDVGHLLFISKETLYYSEIQNNFSKMTKLIVIARNVSETDNPSIKIDQKGKHLLVYWFDQSDATRKVHKLGLPKMIVGLVEAA